MIVFLMFIFKYELILIKSIIDRDFKKFFCLLNSMRIQNLSVFLYLIVIFELEIAHQRSYLSRFLMKLPFFHIMT